VLDGTGRGPERDAVNSRLKRLRDNKCAAAQ
jgi:hypothetical protein